MTALVSSEVRTLILLKINANMDIRITAIQVLLIVSCLVILHKGNWQDRGWETYGENYHVSWNSTSCVGYFELCVIEFRRRSAENEKTYL